ncbi:MAG: serine/threonine-protein phosphatase [Planctomycetota bacterium]|nr:MAG: serine/threonine-protein phosphatase [Planctomycetota bacterium]
MVDPSALDPELRRELEAADACEEIAVVYDPVPEVLEAYAFEGRIGVVAVVGAGAAAEAAALDAGAIEVLTPATPRELALARLRNAVARFRSRLKLERAVADLGREADTNERHLRLAAQLQRSLLPRSLPEVAGVRFSTAYLPRDFVSGDTYELRLLGPERVALFTLDAVGHGVRAALLTTLLRSLFRPLQGEQVRSPGEVLGELNGYLLDAQLDESPTAAFCYGLLDLPSRRLCLANAGHPSPVRIRPNGKYERLGGSGLLLGIDPAAYEDFEVELEPGDRVVFFTDGADPVYDERFLRKLVELRDLDLELQVGGALGEVIALDEEGRPEDDVTAVAFELTTE